MINILSRLKIEFKWINKHISELILFFMLLCTIILTSILTFYSNSKFELVSSNLSSNSSSTFNFSDVVLNNSVSTSNNNESNGSINSLTSNSGSSSQSNKSNSKLANSQNSNSVSNTLLSTSSSSSVSTIESPSAIVAFYGDNQSDTDEEDNNHTRVVNYILASGASTVFSAGDIMEDGTLDSLNRFNTVTSTLRSTRTFYSALGNNDRVEGDPNTPSQLFLDNFVFPGNERWFSVNIGNLHLVVLDSAFASANQSQFNWLESDLLSDESQSRVTGVLFHHPTFASTISSYLVNNNADFVVSGHTHTYQHTTSNNINYFVTSGQPNIGYLLAYIYLNKGVIKYFNQNNTLVDTVEFNER